MLPLAHPPRIHEQLAGGEQLLVGRDTPPDLQRIPADGPRRAGVQAVQLELLIRDDVHHLPPARAEVQDDDPEIQFATFFPGQPLGAHRLAEAGVGADGGVGHVVSPHAQQCMGEFAAFHAEQVAQHHLALQVGVKGEGRDALLHSNGRAFLEQSRRGVGRGLHRGQQRRIAVAVEDAPDPLAAGGGGESLGVQADVALFFRGQGPGAHRGDHVLQAVECEGHQGFQRLFALG